MSDDKTRRLYEVFDGRCMVWIAAETCEEALALARVYCAEAGHDANETCLGVIPLPDEVYVSVKADDLEITRLAGEWAERAGKSCVVLTEDW